jgi:hypothetical protein
MRVRLDHHILGGHLRQGERVPVGGGGAYHGAWWYGDPPCDVGGSSRSCP